MSPSQTMHQKQAKAKHRCCLQAQERLACDRRKAQQAGKVPRLGVLCPAELPSPEEPNLAVFRQALRHLGYVEGQTVTIE
jgi:hypothetical protein